MNENIKDKIPNFQDYFDALHHEMNSGDIVCMLVGQFGVEATAQAIDEADICPAVPGAQLVDIYMRNRVIKGERS